ncbi:MAG: LacI family DNA-binding transcriptional regulator [Oscillospiraceae bacterium]|nr:LacI family DNA-binding transcriptional regulator [Oscillospiraceae bacterium]
MVKEVKMKDIAEKLGVSIVAVSKALSGKSGVSDELRMKIRKTADEMGYRYAASLKRKADRSNNIGVIVAERYVQEDSFYFKFFRHISQLLQVSDHYAFFQTLSQSAEDNAILPKIFFQQRVDGIIMLGQVSKKYTRAILDTKIPVVFLDFYNEQVNTDCVICDSFYASYEMTNYLIQNGHRDIAFVGNIHATSSIQDRYLGYYKSLIEHNIPIREQYVLSDRDLDTGLQKPVVLPIVMPTAFVCNCDETACMLIAQLKRLGYRVPEDISVTGFDNSVYSTISDPHVTTIEVNTAYMSKLAVEGLLQKIEKPSFSMGMVHVNGKIIYKDSVRSLNY